MANTPSIIEVDTRLAELNNEILKLETERSSLLRGELSKAEQRVSEIEAFIGVLTGSAATARSGATPARDDSDSVAVTVPVAAPRKKKSAKKKTKSAAKEAPSAPAPKKKGAPKKASAGAPTGGGSRAAAAAERLSQLQSIVAAAGANGISAKKAAVEADIPYVSALKILNGNPDKFRQAGEKRDSRFYSK